MTKLLTTVVLSLIVLGVNAQALGQIALRQSDAIELKFGPLVDETDGDTPMTGLTVDETNVLLSKCGAAGTCAAFAGKNDTTNCTHDAGGWYECPLNTTDTDTIGILYVSIQATGAAPYWTTFQVVDDDIFDASMASTSDPVDGAAILADTNEVQISLAAGGLIESLVDDIPAVLADTDEVQISLAAGGLIESLVDDIPAVLADTDEVQVSLAAGGLIESLVDDIGVAGVGLTAVSVAAGGIAAGDFAAGAITAASTAADFSTEVQDADLESINGVTITGDGGGTPFGVTWRQEQRDFLGACMTEMSKRDIRKAVRLAERYGFRYDSCNDVRFTEASFKTGGGI